MGENFEGRIKKLELEIAEAKKFEQSSELVRHGERIIQLIREGDYSEARMVTRCLIECGSTIRAGEEVSNVITNYLETAYNLAIDLPKNQEYIPSRDSWRD